MGKGFAKDGIMKTTEEALRNIAQRSKPNNGKTSFFPCSCIGRQVEYHRQQYTMRRVQLPIA